MHFVLHGKHETRIVTEPTVLGHEASGIIIKLGTNVEISSLKVGTRVAIEPNTFCTKCDVCRAGKQNLCKHQVEIPPRVGLFQEYVVWPSYLLHPIPDNVSLLEAAQIEPLSTFVYLLNNRLKFRPGSRVLVLGCGPMGLIATLSTKAFGAGQVCVTDVSQMRIDYLLKNGADLGFRIDPCKQKDVGAVQIIKQQAEEIRKLFGGKSPDVVFDCCGYDSTVMLALEAVNYGGTYIQIGVGGVTTSEATISLPLFLTSIVPKGVTIIGVTKTASDGFSAGINLVSSGKIDIKRVAAHIKRLEEFDEAFLGLTAAGKSPSKVMLKISESDE